MKEGTLRTRDGAKLWYEVHSENKSGVPLIMVSPLSAVCFLTPPSDLYAHLFRRIGDGHVRYRA